MRCHDANHRLTAREDSQLTEPESLPVEERLTNGANCGSFKGRQQSLDGMLQPPLSHMYQPISTYRIMQAVQQQRQITRQLEDIRTQQKARLRMLSPVLACVCLSVGGLAVLILVLAFFQPEGLVRFLATMSDVIGAFFFVAQYLQTGLAFITRNSMILSGIALILVVMMGMWLRLMRYPRA
jgi:hypothetical protein